jgi:hypothetical protein
VSAHAPPSPFRVRREAPRTLTVAVRVLRDVGSSAAFCESSQAHSAGGGPAPTSAAAAAPSTPVAAAPAAPAAVVAAAQSSVVAVAGAASEAAAMAAAWEVWAPATGGNAPFESPAAAAEAAAQAANNSASVQTWHGKAFTSIRSPQFVFSKHTPIRMFNGAVLGERVKWGSGSGMSAYRLALGDCLVDGGLGKRGEGEPASNHVGSLAKRLRWHHLRSFLRARVRGEAGKRLAGLETYA